MDSATDWHLSVYRSGGHYPGKKQRCPKVVKERILKRQGGLCFYCDREFGCVVHRRGRPVLLRVEWDHYVPFSYSLRNDSDNWVAACQVCNNIKGALVFETVERARE